MFSLDGDSSLGVGGFSLIGEPEGVASNGVMARLGCIRLNPESLKDGCVMLMKLVAGEFSSEVGCVRLLRGVLESMFGVVLDVFLENQPSESRCLGLGIIKGFKTPRGHG